MQVRFGECVRGHKVGRVFVEITETVKVCRGTNSGGGVRCRAAE